MLDPNHTPTHNVLKVIKDVKIMVLNTLLSSGNIYPTNIVEKAVTSYQPVVPFGEYRTPNDGNEYNYQRLMTIELSNVSHRAINLRVVNGADGDVLIGDVEIIDTVYGKVLADLPEDRIFWIFRALIDQQVTGNHHTVIMAKIISIDAMITPEPSDGVDVSVVSDDGLPPTITIRPLKPVIMTHVDTGDQASA
jgi:hypothetical protein